MQVMALEQQSSTSLPLQDESHVNTMFPSTGHRITSVTEMIGLADQPTFTASFHVSQLEDDPPLYLDTISQRTVYRPSITRKNRATIFKFQLVEIDSSSQDEVLSILSSYVTPEAFATLRPGSDSNSRTIVFTAGDEMQAFHVRYNDDGRASVSVRMDNGDTYYMLPFLQSGGEPPKPAERLVQMQKGDPQVPQYVVNLTWEPIHKPMNMND